MAGNLWTPEELNILRHHYPSGGSARAVTMLRKVGSDRTRDSIRLKANQLGLTVAMSEPAGYSTSGSIAVRVPPDLLQKLDRARGGTQRSVFIRSILEQHL